jgi:predicted N-acetyltransferase YhbS
MAERKGLQFKVASTPDEIEQIHALNYRTFVEEIPQHRPNHERRLVDRFHEQNTYLICLRGDRLVGMMALRAERPFSLDAKLPALDKYLPPGRSLCELRLLAVEPGQRRGRVFWGLARLVWEHFRGRGWDMAVASCTPRQMKLYRHLGFEPFGPLVGTSEAPFQPMYLTIEMFEERTRALEQRTRFGVRVSKARRTGAAPATG